ncbi:Fanconi anemia group j protein-like protein [Thalictrum thalictroides]|uniref:DNA 5'-3' helicase FANCJ n=1 Tax=Thalictrum thalictroides TaxID=46969 RepID=A0A7J6VPC9_THATH|nr:Fanconi anemia group j protein-like protein [Thalictrum thalictroides]
MELETQNPSSNPNPKNVYHIGGIPVEFPYKPYGSQLAFMSRAIATLDRAEKEGHCHALLESPTGTGKTLSLLCSVLAWQQKYKSKNLYANLSHSKPDPEAVLDPLGHGGGFVPEPEPSSNLPAENVVPGPTAKNSGNDKKKSIPTIFYASRTHAQITQVIREYRKTSYRVPMAVLGSRKHYCTNKDVAERDNIDEECKLLMKSKPGDQGCLQFRNVNKVIGHSTLQKGGCNEAHDIEDLVKVGRTVRARTMAQEAQLVFCPYSYILNPSIRRAMEVDLKNSIVILDEAHNIEDIARDAASVDIEEDVLFILHRELEQLSFVDSLIYQPLHEMIEGVISWIGQRKNTLVKREFQHYSSCWTGDKASVELQEAGISRQFFQIIQECTTKAIKAASDPEETSILTGVSSIALEGLVSSLGYFFSGNGSHALDYQLVLQRYFKREAGSSGKWTQSSSNWTTSLSMWCMNPAVSFTKIADLSMSVILTSGTLSPMTSFSSELGVKFETCMEAPHVIDVQSQLWAAIISAGPGNYPLNASYKTADGYDFQDALGTSLEEICKIVPGGALVFFPSYSLMEKLCTRWRETGQWVRLNAQKTVFVEPRGQKDDFELTLKDYYDSIRRGNGPAAWKIKRGRKRSLKHTDVDETLQHSINGGSAFLAVCRGKVSEGIDFSDENARVVVSFVLSVTNYKVIVGIPFPNMRDLKVGLKKSFNDTYKSSKKLLSGSEWYCQQAFRALNQAAGRCIRHRFDYGGIIFMDERFKEERNIAYVSKWLRKCIKQYSSFEMSLEGLKSFFQDAKERSDQKTPNVTEDIEEVNISSTKPTTFSKGPGKRKNHRSNKSDQLEDNATLHKFYNKGDVVDLTYAQTDEMVMIKFREYIDLEHSPREDLRQSENVSMATSQDSPEGYLVKKTPVMNENVTTASSVVLSNENSSSTIVQTYSDLSDQLSFHSSPLDKSSGTLSVGKPSFMITPEKLEAEFDDAKPKDDSFNLSVNSHTQKRRKSIKFSLRNYSEMDPYSNLDHKIPVVECTELTSYKDANRKIEFSSEVDHNEFQNTNLNVIHKFKTNNCCTSCLSSNVIMDKRLHLCCALCTKSLGLPDNHFLVECSMTSCSKVYLASFLESRSEDATMNASDTVSVVISNTSSLDQQLYNSPTSEDRSKHDIWCEKDGCVFRNVFCPFCTVSDRFLGVLIMATDAQNIHLLNKILFYVDRLEIRNVKTSKEKAFLPVGHLDVGQAVSNPNLNEVSTDLNRGHVAALASIDNFSYVSGQQSCGVEVAKEVIMSTWSLSEHLSCFKASVSNNTWKIANMSNAALNQAHWI